MLSIDTNDTVSRVEEQLRRDAAIRRLRGQIRDATQRQRPAQRTPAPALSGWPATSVREQ